MKLRLALSLLLLSLTVQAAPKAQKGCSFIRHHHDEVEGKDIPKELRNKILNDFNPDKVVVQKTNEELNIFLWEGDNLELPKANKKIKIIQIKGQDIGEKIDTPGNAICAFDK